MRLAIVTCFVLLLFASGVAPCGAEEPASGESPDRSARLLGMRAELRLLEVELAGLRRREQVVLGELERLGAELRLRGAEFDEVSLRSEDVAEAIDRTTVSSPASRRTSQRRRSYLASRLRQIYKEGPSRAVRRFLGGESVEHYWSGVRYAAYLSRKDGRVLGAYRDDAERLEAERQGLMARQTEYRAVGEDLSGARMRLSGTRERRARLLEEIRADAGRREVALEELQAAADSLASLVETLPSSDEVPELDVHKFRGLLDWPAEGRVTDGFGSVIHPRFKTRVPHPGLDIEGQFGDDIQAASSTGGSSSPTGCAATA